MEAKVEKEIDVTAAIKKRLFLLTSTVLVLATAILSYHSLNRFEYSLTPALSKKRWRLVRV